MRLIDADKLIKRLQEWNTRDDTDKALFDFSIYRIIEQPTAYDVDKVVEQLEEKKKRATELCLAINDSVQRLKYIEKEQAMALAIEIVKAGGVNAKEDS